MRFDTLEIVADGQNGWGSGLLEFGQDVTQLFAENESGKTPLIMSSLFCLGMDVNFRADIIKNCRTARLQLTINSRQFIFERVIGERFDITVSEQSRTVNRFYNDEDFSLFFLKLINVKTSKLITSSGASTLPYFSGLIPLFYLDQDHGYSEFTPLDTILSKTNTPKW